MASGSSEVRGEADRRVYKPIVLFTRDPRPLPEVIFLLANTVEKAFLARGRTGGDILLVRLCIRDGGLPVRRKPNQ